MSVPGVGRHLDRSGCSRFLSCRLAYGVDGAAPREVHSSGMTASPAVRKLQADGGSARLWSRNHLIDVVGEIAQSKSGSIHRPVPTCRNGRYFYCTCHDQRRSDGRSCLNFSRFHFSSLSSPLKPPFLDDDDARIAPSAQTPPKRWRSQGRDGAATEAGSGARRIVRQPVQLGVKKDAIAAPRTNNHRGVITPTPNDR
jgi:hypothetical protein